MIRPSSTAQEKVPFSHTSAHGSGACCCDYGTRSLRERSGTSLESGWKNLCRGCNSWKPKCRLPKTPEETWLISEWERSRRRSRVNRMSGKVGHSRCDSTSRRWMKNSLLGTRECGSESVARDALGRGERASEETSETACVHVDDAQERSSTSDDHETERSSGWVRYLETFPGRVGAGTQRTVPSDADAVVAVSVCGRQRSGLGGVGTTCATM